jgi:hypothetical protein
MIEGSGSGKAQKHVDPVDPDSDPKRIRKKHYGSGQLRLRNEFEVKLLRIGSNPHLTILNKNDQFKHINSFLSHKNSSEKLI